MESLIKTRARELGFELVGISNSPVSIEDKIRINSWIEKGFYGNMNWFLKNQDLRLELKNLGFTVNSIISLGILYNPKNYSNLFKNSKLKISRYSLGTDYHKAIRKIIKPLMDELKSDYPSNHFRHGVDSLPIPEKIFARNSGIGWISKNTNIINSQYGSYFFLTEILTDLKLSADTPTANRCGSCSACMDACPTKALTPYSLDASKCISHHTIEDKREPFPKDASLHSWIFGCDICQEVCPWNKKAERQGIFTSFPEFEENGEWNKIISDDFQFQSENEYNEFVKNKAIERISYSQWKRNIAKAESEID